MLKRLLTAGAVSACLIGSAQPAQAAPTLCWYAEDDSIAGTVSAYDCDVERYTDSDGVIWYRITDEDGVHRIALWERDGVPEYAEVIWQGGRRKRVDHWEDSDGDMVVGFKGDWWFAFRVPSSRPSTPARPSYDPPVWDAPAPVRGGGLSSGEFSDRPFLF